MTWTVSLPWWAWLSPFFLAAAGGFALVTIFDVIAIRERRPFTYLLWPRFIGLGLLAFALSYVPAVLSD